MPRPLDPLDAVVAAVRTRLGVEPTRASVSFVGVEPIEVLRFVTDDGLTTYVSLGMSRHPMAGDNPDLREGPRAELVLRVRDRSGRHPYVWRSLAVLAAAPAVESVVHRPGASTDLGQPMSTGSRWWGVVVGDDAFPAVLSHAWAEPVQLLEVLPATADELAWARVHGGAALRAKWQERATDLRDPDRPSVTYD